MSGSVTTRQAAQALGVSEASLKRWCNIGVLPAVRTPGGHRRLPVSAVIQFVRERRLELVRPQVLGLPALAQREGNDYGPPHAAVEAALAAADENALRTLVFGPYLGGVSAAEILDERVAPAFAALGERWDHGALAVYEERRAVEICIRLLHELRLMLPAPPSDAPHAIGGTLSGDPYALPTTMVEVALVEAGWRAQSYGCGLPAATWGDAIRDVRPRVLWLSVSAFASEQQFLADYAVLHAAAQEVGVAILLGGRMLKPELRARMQYAAYADTLRHAVAFVHALHPPAPMAATTMKRSAIGAAHGEDAQREVSM